VDLVELREQRDALAGEREPIPICGTGLPVSWMLIAIAGTRKAVISTQYWATCVQVMPFMPPSVA
jgi:hypothetical protein